MKARGYSGIKTIRGTLGDSAVWDDEKRHGVCRTRRHHDLNHYGGIPRGQERDDPEIRRKQRKGDRYGGKFSNGGSQGRYSDCDAREEAGEETLIMWSRGNAIAPAWGGEKSSIDFAKMGRNDKIHKKRFIGSPAKHHTRGSRKSVSNQP